MSPVRAIQSCIFKICFVILRATPRCAKRCFPLGYLTIILCMFVYIYIYIYIYMCVCVCVCVYYPICVTCPAYLVPLYLTTLMMYGVEFNSRSSSLLQFVQPAVTSPLLGRYSFLSSLWLFLNTSSLYSSPSESVTFNIWNLTFYVQLIFRIYRCLRPQDAGVHLMKRKIR